MIPQVLGLDHVAIVVRDTESALALWRDGFGFLVSDSEVVNGGAVRLTHLQLGNTQLQLVEPLSSESPLAAIVARSPATLHHLCFQVATVDEFAQLSSKPPHEGVRGQRSLFLDLVDSNGVTIEVTGG